MSKIKLFGAGEVVFDENSRFTYFVANNEFHKELTYPKKRYEPDLYFNVVGSLEVVEGGYMWAANPSHLLYDVFSDLLIARTLNPDVKVSIKAYQLGRSVLKLLDVEIVEGVDSIGNPGSAVGSNNSYFENPWRFNGQKLQYLSKLIRKNFYPAIHDGLEERQGRNYIIQRRAKHGHEYSRSIHNIQQVVEFFASKSIYFDVVYLEDISIQAQINIFASAKTIVSTHGSGLVWLNFCKRNTIVIELITPYFFNGKSVKSDFWFISQAHNLKHLSVVGFPVIGNPSDAYNNNVIVDCEILYHILQLEIESLSK